MQNLESVAHKMAVLWVLMYFLYFCNLFGLYTNFHAKSGVCSSKNGWVIALGTKEDTYSSIIIYLQVIIQSKLFCSKFASLDNNFKIVVETVSPQLQNWFCKICPPQTKRKNVVSPPHYEWSLSLPPSFNPNGLSPPKIWAPHFLIWKLKF